MMMMMMMMMMMIFLQSKLSCDLWCTCFITKTEVLFFLSLCSRSWFLGDECFFLTCRRVVFCHSRKRSKEDWEKNTTDTWGGKKKSKFEARRTTTTTTKKGEGAYYWRDNVYSYSRHKNEYVFALQKVLF
jgi:hypothetical protein